MDDSSILRVHPHHDHIHGDILLPRHLETPQYEHVHHQLTRVLDKPCFICGVRNSTLSDPEKNPKGSQEMETHHSPIERSLLEACDWRRVHEDFPQVVSQESLEDFVDSGSNMIVLCDICHRLGDAAIHTTTHPYWVIGKYLKEGYILVKEENISLEEKKDQLIEESLPPVVTVITSGSVENPTTVTIVSPGDGLAPTIATSLHPEEEKK